MITDYRWEARNNIAEAVVARGAVRRGRHLRFACPAHDDRRPSADYKPILGVWVCRSCGAGGGRRNLAKRLGLILPEAPSPRRPPPIPPPPSRVSREEWIPAWTAIVEEARQQDRRLARYREVERIADWLRQRNQTVAATRRIASRMGDDPRAWWLLSTAARVSTEAASIEAMLDNVARGIGA
jgi:hypothetical protein